jgi:hypothetical protein
MTKAIEKQSTQKSKKPSTKGGARPGAGRPKGSTNKVTAQDFLEKYKKRFGVEYVDDILNNFAAANALLSTAGAVGDPQAIIEALTMKHKYDTMVAKYIWKDVQELDVTTGGEKLQASFNFVSAQLPDWKDNQ